MSAGVTVGKLTVNCAVPRNHPEPARVQARLDEVARGPLHAALATMLEPLSRHPSDEVVVIERLELGFDLDTSGDVDELARVRAARLAAGLAGALAQTTRVSHAHFPDEAHYLARFLVDTAAGQASRKWYYRRFRGFSALPAAAILRSAIVDEPARGCLALMAMSEAELSSVLAALGEREAERVIETLRGLDGEREDFDAAATAIVEAAPAFLALAIDAGGAVAALGLISRALTGCEPSRWPSLARLAQAVSAAFLAPAARRAEGALVEGAPRSAAPARDEPGELSPLLALLPERRAELAAALRRAEDERARAEAPSQHTRFGGLILLLKRIADLPIERMLGDEEAAARVRLVLLSRAAGSSRRRAVLADALLQRLCGLGTRVDPDETEAFIAERGGELLSALTPAFVELRAPFCSAEVVTLGRAAAVGSVAVTVGEPEGYWLALTPGWRAATIDLVRARAASKTLRHLVDGGAPREMELGFALLAQHVLHGFGRTLPGFSTSSPAFLYDNFLAFSATVEDLGGRLVCKMDRPPLGALLAFTGAQRGRLALPWLPGGGLELYS